LEATATDGKDKNNKKDDKTNLDMMLVRTVTLLANEK
jgi:hypothetical protein